MNFVKKSAGSFASSAFIIIKCLGSVLFALLWDYTCTIIIIIVITAPQSCSLARFSNKQKTSHFPPPPHAFIFSLAFDLWCRAFACLQAELLCCNQGQTVCSTATQLSFFLFYYYSLESDDFTAAFTTPASTALSRCCFCCSARRRREFCSAGPNF